MILPLNQTRFFQRTTRRLVLVAKEPCSKPPWTDPLQMTPSENWMQGLGASKISLKMSIRSDKVGIGRSQQPSLMNVETLINSPLPNSKTALLPNLSIRRPQGSHRSSQNAVSWPFPIRWWIRRRMSTRAERIPLHPQEQFGGIDKSQKDLPLIYFPQDQSTQIDIFLLAISQGCLLKAATIRDETLNQDHLNQWACKPSTKQPSSS